MSSSNLSNGEKRKIANERQNAVRKAWKNEGERIKLGKGIRKWNPEEQREILERGSAKGYEGHHMKSVSLFSQYAGEPNNIQFLTEEEHLYGAHNGSYHNLTNGYYDPYEKRMIEFQGDKLSEIPEYDLGIDEASGLKEEILNQYSDDNNTMNNEDETILTSEESNTYEVWIKWE